MEVYLLQAIDLGDYTVILLNTYSCESEAWDEYDKCENGSSSLLKKFSKETLINLTFDVQRLVIKLK
jgi:hypothetical protein